MKGVGPLAALVTTLALAAPAGATTYTVDPAGGACTSASPTCPSIQAAAAQMANGDSVEIRPKPGGWTESATFTRNGISVAGRDAGDVRINGTLTFTGSGALTVSRLVVLP